jgi:hypothetical protein
MDGLKSEARDLLERERKREIDVAMKMRYCAYYLLSIAYLRCECEVT